ncbi:hypothetical protein H0H87_012408 [Tephrocybe sp. NHM501043]|nr:hypothetical protein H0H87_012408 [Tephrocybe sp. NHM501043]
MPVLSRLSSPTIDVFHSANSLPQEVWTMFRSDPRNSNIIYSHALKARHDFDDYSDNQVWIVCTTDGVVDFVLSCTHHALGTYPIFIYSAHPAPRLTFPFVNLRIQLMAVQLRESVAVERDDTDRSIRGTILRRQIHLLHPPELEDPTIHHFTCQAVLWLCGGGGKFVFFLEPSVAKLFSQKPFVLTLEGAMKEAAHLISNNQLWVHTIQNGDQTPEIASIVAVTRESASVAAITKVFTNPDWRSRRCAERLVRKVTQT